MHTPAYPQGSLAMYRPESDMPAPEGEVSSIDLDDVWGSEKEKREIALLEAHLLKDTIARTIELALAAIESDTESTCSGENKKEALRINIEDELRQSYLDYAMSVIVGRTLPCSKAIRNIQTLSKRAMALFPHLAHRLSAALAIHRLTSAEKACSVLILKFRKSAESALFRQPLFAYGPELSDFRHRHR